MNISVKMVFFHSDDANHRLTKKAHGWREKHSLKRLGNFARYVGKLHRDESSHREVAKDTFGVPGWDLQIEMHGNVHSARYRVVCT